MSIIFGIRKSLGALVSEQELHALADATERYASDGATVRAEGRVGMGLQRHHTHPRSKLELHPAADALGNLLVLDGRIDNYQDLCRELDLRDRSTPDSQIILAAFLRWGNGCFSRFIGDWALALWSTQEQALYLARDHAGTRTLYFETKNDTILWCTHLDGFFTSPRSINVADEYAACYLAAQPIRDLTPYKDIRAVLPAHYLVAEDDKLTATSHWQWMKTAKIRYNADKEYEDHFLEVFRRAVERRDGPDASIVAQLSGGMDSASIVCMSDHSRRSQHPSAELLDTISFYDDSEQSWNEKPYFSAVENGRGKVGVHINASFMKRTFEPHNSAQGIYYLPGADSSAIEREREIHVVTGDKAYRVILSGIGGDEVLGGVPTPKPELADYLVSGNLHRLLTRTIDWCLTDRSPLFHMLFDVMKYACDLYRPPHAENTAIPPWIEHRLRETCAKLATRDVTDGNRRGLTPSSIGNGLAWWSIMETLPHTYPGLLSRPEYRYPYLDKQLVDYLFSIPPEQLVRPGRRRSLMRRALKNIVPDVVLERRRKAYQIRAPLSALRQARSKLDALFVNALIIQRGYAEPAKLKTALDMIDRGREIRWWPGVMRAISLELWLRGHGTEHRANHLSPP